jgi:hypothetical protein
MRRAWLVMLVFASCRSPLDANIRAARQRVVSASPEQIAELAAYCDDYRRTRPRDFAAALEHWPRFLADLPPTSIDEHAGTVTLDWWNNSHYEEDEPHPQFQVVCTSAPRAGDRSLGRGVWLHDVAEHAN